MGQNSETTGTKLKSIVWEMGEHFLQDSGGAFFKWVNISCKTVGAHFSNG